VRGHAGFDPDQAWRHVHQSFGNSLPRDLFAQNDGAPLIQADQVKRVLASIDPNRADNAGIVLRGMVCSSCSSKTPK
jgi:hypothetical protein